MHAVHTQRIDAQRYRARAQINRHLVEVDAQWDRAEAKWRFHVYLHHPMTAACEELHLDGAEADTHQEAIQVGLVAARQFLN